MRTTTLALSLILLSPAGWADDLDCKIGPLQKNFGGSPWLVYACTDGHSLAIISAPGRKAMPFYFFETWGKGGYQLSGEGSGNKAATDAAFADLRKLDNNAIMALVQQAKQIK